MDLTSYNILLKASCSAKKVDLAQDIYKEVKHLASNGELQLDVVTYSTMIKVGFKAEFLKTQKHIIFIILSLLH